MSYIDEKKTGYLVIAYPELSKKDAEWIARFRKAHDPLFYNIIEPHITFVLPTFGIARDDFIAEIEAKSENIQAFNFTCRCALMNNDRLSEYYHIFLAPD